MGVRLREELRQVLDLNNSSQDKKMNHVREVKENAKKTFVVEREGEDPRASKTGGAKNLYQPPPSKQMLYPLLKPVAFTNALEDDYLSLGVWSLK